MRKKIPTFLEAKDPNDQKQHLSTLSEMPIPSGHKNCLLNIKFVIIGNLPALTISQTKNLIELYGGKIESDLTYQPDVIIQGYDVEKIKELQDSQNKDIQITDQEGLFTFISNTNPLKKDIQNNDNSQIKNYIEKLQLIHTEILKYFDNSQIEENFESICILFDNHNITKDKNTLTEILHLLTKISNNHYHLPEFYSKVEKILILFKNSIQRFYSNNEIFNIFKSNKRILFFLHQEHLLTFDDNLIQKIITEKYVNKFYPQYFQPEIQPFVNEKWFPKYNKDDWRLKNNEWVEDIKKELPNNFYENRKIGENENEICKLIRNDSIKEFIVYVNKKKIKLNSNIKSSIYETNSELMTNQDEVSLIEYASFFGSIQIFNYLSLNEVKLTRSLMKYVIHGQNAEIIHKMEEINFNYEDLLFEAIKCHNNDIAIYFLNNYLNDYQINSKKIIFKNYNFLFIEGDFIDQFSFLFLCKYDYCQLLKLLLSCKDIYVNEIYRYNDDLSYYHLLRSEASNWITDIDDYDYQVQIEKVALYIAIEKENIEIINLLLLNDKTDLKAGKKLNLCLKTKYENCFAVKEEDTLFHFAIEKENIDIIKLLLNNKKIDVNKTYKFYKFGRDCSEHIIEIIEETPLHYAINNEKVDIVELLLMNDKIDVNKLLINNNVSSTDGDDTPCKGYTPLSLAIKNKNIEIIKLIFKNNRFDINVNNSYKCVNEWGDTICPLWNYDTESFTLSLKIWRKKICILQKQKHN